jgi:hypothetical protein
MIENISPNRYKLSKKGISAILDNVSEVQQTDDGNFIVVGTSAPPTLVSYTPAFGYNSVYPQGNNGAVKNIRGFNNSLSIHRNSLPLPSQLLAGDALIISKAAVTPGTSPKDGYFDGLLGGSEVDEMMTIVSVSYPLNVPLFRPPALGDGPIVKFLRSGPIPKALLNLNKLPSIINLNQTGPRPPIAFLEKLFSDFSGDAYGDWECTSRIPDLQHPGYGSFFAGAVSTALTYLCSTEPVESKRKLATSMVQWGLDLAGAWGDGRVNYNNGGHMQGRKALIILAGHLLNLGPLSNPNSIVGPAFQEDQAYFKQTDKAWWFGWKYGWESHRGFDTKSWLRNEPSTWTNGFHGSNAWSLSGYMQHVLGCQVGTALAMKLMGLGYEMGESYMGMIEQWMQGPPPAEDAKLRAVGVNLPWGNSYEIGFPDQFNAKAWQQVFPRQ